MQLCRLCSYRACSNSARQPVGRLGGEQPAEDRGMASRFEGCGVEKANFDDPENYLRRAAVLAVVAVRLMQLRDLADTGKPIAQDPKALCKWLPKLWRTVAAKLLKIPLAELTPRQFLLLVAKRGGYIGRNSDPRPGMKVLWRGWFAFHLLVQGASLFSPNNSSG